MTKKETITDRQGPFCKFILLKLWFRALRVYLSTNIIKILTLMKGVSNSPPNANPDILLTINMGTAVIRLLSLTHIQLIPM